ncbi:hypothetical protein IGI04_007713 [Brassica rapa subsp. trilocularis]|uniref:DUF7792 domain-containing protein n=1 Tax=Brassica rapa subsp. trilocularis TaxID=1813537 RepID=A0ABQ7NKJ5_BRACM|nr:hypothetical protein IGI04_007713 [Brassica rapa subsp. trilocularis]
MKQILAKPIQLSDQVMKAADEASSFKQECAEFKAKTEKLAGILCQVARASSDLYERPTHHIIDDTEQMLDQAFSLVLKCRVNGITKRVFTIIPSIRPKRVSINSRAWRDLLVLVPSLLTRTRPKQVKRIEISDQHW